MKRIYLDWGVISNLKKEEYTTLRELLLSNKDRLFFVYSSAHFEDLMRSKGDPRFESDLRMLTDLAGDHFLDIDNNGITHPYRVLPEQISKDYSEPQYFNHQDIDSLIESVKEIPIVGIRIGDLITDALNVACPIPSDIYSNELLKKTFPNLPVSPTIKDLIESFCQFMHDMMSNKGSYKGFRTEIRNNGFDLGPSAGNWNDNDATEQISLFLKSKGIEMTFNDYVMKSFGNRKISQNELFISAYCILDMIGFHSDKLPKDSNTMNSVTTDAKHAYFGGHCDWFITADKRLYHKARALYSNFGVLTNVMYPDEAITAIQNEILPYEHNYINTFFQDELIPDHIVDRHYKEDDADCDYVVYEFSKYFLGIFSHCTHYYNSDDSSTLQFKLVFGNYSRFLFYDETSIMLDTLTQIFGLQGIADYDKTREKIIKGDTDVTISWSFDKVFVCIKNDEDRHRPELFILFKHDVNA